MSPLGVHITSRQRLLRCVLTTHAALTQMGASELLMVAAAVEAQAVAAPVRSARSVEVSEDAVEALVGVEVLVWSARPVVEVEVLV